MNNENQVDLYGADHSPWVQAVLLGLHDADISYSVTSVPPWMCLRKTGIRMPAASFNSGPWLMESADILQEVGYQPISTDEMKLVQRAWQGVMHRTDSAALFWGGFSLAGDRNAAFGRRWLNNFLRSFVTFYFFLLIRCMVIIRRSQDPEDFAEQFLPFEERLRDGGPFLSGDAPDTIDFLLFGVIQCHSSVYVPPLTALQADSRLEKVRDWISTMQTRFADYDRLYSVVYFTPHRVPPTWAAPLDRAIFWLGAIAMFALFPVTIPLVTFLAIRNLRS